MSYQMLTLLRALAIFDILAMLVFAFTGDATMFRTVRIYWLMVMNAGRLG